MKATYINIGECGYAEVYPLEGGTYDGRMLNLDSRESFPWFKGHEPLYCLGNNGCRRELFFDLGGARVSGTVYERIMTGQNVEVLSAMPAVVSDTFFMACEIYPPLSDVLLVKCSQLQDPRLKNSFGYVPAHFEKGLGIVFDEDILNPSLLISKVKKILAKRPALIPTFQSLFEGVSSDFFQKFPDIFVAMALAHELGHIKQIMDEYCCNISRFAKERKSDMQADVGYISLVDAINKGVSGEALADIERKYRASKFELYADNFAVEVFTNNIEYYTRNIRINCAG